MSGRLAGKTALITGAARGQGAAEARLFVSEGARVVIADVLEAEGKALADELGEQARFVALDVTSEEQWSAAVARTVDEFGSLDVLVNNAGVLRFNRVQSETVEGFRSVLDVNLVGVLLGMQAVASPMADVGGGSIVNISSTAGIVGMPGTAAYVASKWGVTGLTKAAAIDLGPSHIRVNSVHPGSIDTPMIRMDGLPTEAFEPYYRRLPIKRLGTASEVANVVLFLASDESSYCTGAAFVVDGGQTCGDHGLMGG